MIAVLVIKKRTIFVITKMMTLLSVWLQATSTIISNDKIFYEQTL